MVNSPSRSAGCWRNRAEPMNETQGLLYVPNLPTGCPQCGFALAGSPVLLSCGRCGFRWLRGAQLKPNLATQLAIYETAVTSTAMAAPNWAAFSRWMSAGAGTLIGLTVSNLASLALRENPASMVGVAFAALSLLPALRVEWLYLFLQPISAAHKAGEGIFEKLQNVDGGNIDSQRLAAFFVERAPKRMRKKLGPLTKPDMDFLGLANFFVRLANKGRRIVIWQMGLLSFGALLLAVSNFMFT